MKSEKIMEAVTELDDELILEKIYGSSGRLRTAGRRPDHRGHHPFRPGQRSIPQARGPRRRPGGACLSHG